MSKSYDLEIIKAVKKILVDDNNDPDPNNNEYCIHTFVEDRIYQGDSPISQLTLPHITISFDAGEGDGDLPVEHGELRVKVWFDQVSREARTKCRRCTFRVSALLDRQVNSINSANSNITVRLCDKITHVLLVDPDTNTYYGSLAFDVTFKRVIGD